MGNDPHMPVPYADPILARSCSVCRGWGTVITDRGSYELCPECQFGAEKDEHTSGVSREDSDALWELWLPIVKRELLRSREHKQCPHPECPHQQ